jgi:hypothetical protein
MCEREFVGLAMQAELQLSPDQEQRLLSTREAILGQVQAIAAERQRISGALQVRCPALLTNHSTHSTPPQFPKHEQGAVNQPFNNTTLFIVRGPWHRKTKVFLTIEAR